MALSGEDTDVFPGGAAPPARLGRGGARHWRRYIFSAAAELSKWAKEDFQNLPLWTPVAIGAGAGFYFGLLTEPDWRIAPAVMVVLGLAAIRPTKLRPFFLAALFLCVGFVAADIRTANVSAPILDRELGIVSLEGRLHSVEDRMPGQRFIVELTAIDGVAENDLPKRARISWRGDAFDARPGHIISLRAGLGPPPEPATPGGFDFARQLYFQQIGAVGFAVTPADIDAARSATWADKASNTIETMRQTLFARIVDAAPGEGGAILAAIVTGKRGAIPYDATATLRDTGLAHLLAISGLHMGLATALVFFAVRLGLAYIEPLAAQYPIKKWAAAAALFSGFCYLILSGGGWSARRAFIMTAIIFIAILMDRRALSLRNVAIAAVIILLVTPEALFHPGFQMSFAAVTALIAGYEYANARADPLRSFHWLAKVKRYGIGLAITDLIAALATAPYGLYHFNRVALYSLPANIFAMPVMGFWIMPWAVIGILLLPTGLDPIAWRLAASGMDAILFIAREVASWPGAVSVTMQWPLSALLALTAGGLWLCLSKAPWRLIGLLSLPLSYWLIAKVTPPSLFVASSGLNAGVIISADEAEMAVYNRRRDRFAVDRWMESVGMDFETHDAITMTDIFSCDEDGCIARDIARFPEIVSFVSERSALDEDCARAKLVVAFFPVSGADYLSCNARLIDRRSIWRRGAHAVWFDAGGKIRIKTVSETRGARPWTGADVN